MAEGVIILLVLAKDVFFEQKIELFLVSNWFGGSFCPLFMIA